MGNKLINMPPLRPVSLGLLPDAGVCYLKNKVPVYLLNAGTEDVVRIEFTFAAGNTVENIPLLSSTTNMMLCEGTRNYSSNRLNKMLDYYGAFYNLYSGKDRAGLVVFALNRHIEKILDLCREIIVFPSFPQSELRPMMKKRLRWFLVNRDKVQNLAIDNFFELIFGENHPYGKQVVKDDYLSLEQKMVIDFHKQFYSTSSLTIIVSGLITGNTTNLIEKYFGSDTPDGPDELKNNVLPVIQQRKQVHIPKKGAVQTAIRIGSATINKRHPDYPGLKVLDMILGGYFGSRLMKNIREEKGLTYGISSSVTSLYQSGYKVISTEVGKDNTQKAIEEIYKEIELLQMVPVEKEELSLVRNYMIGEMVRMFDGPFAIAESFRSAWEFGLDNSYYLRLADKIKTIEPDEITALAGTYYNINDLSLVTAG